MTTKNCLCLGKDFVVLSFCRFDVLTLINKKELFNNVFIY